MTESEKKLEDIAYAPYETIENPTMEDWRKSYDALIQLVELFPEDGSYPNTLGYLCFYGRHTGERNYDEARKWFEKGAELDAIESTYKLADMLIAGLGGPKDTPRALKLYTLVYNYCKDQLERGIEDSKFADAALRIARTLHEGTGGLKNDMVALAYLLEAQYALELRMPYDHYGDDTVEKNIQALMDECEKPDPELRKQAFYSVGLSLVTHRFLNFGHRMSFTIQTFENGDTRLEFRRKCGKRNFTGRVLWSIPQAMKSFLTEFVVLYAKDIRLIWNINPEKPVVCDRYEYDQKTNTHLFYLNDQLQCRLLGGDYYLAMDEFIITGMRDSEDGTGIPQ